MGGCVLLMFALTSRKKSLMVSLGTWSAICVDVSLDRLILEENNVSSGGRRRFRLLLTERRRVWQLLLKVIRQVPDGIVIECRK